MERMFPPPKLLSKPVKIEKEALKELLYLPDIFSPTMKSGSYEDFTAQLKRKYGDIFMKRILSSANLKLINSGREASVYEIAGIPDYVVKIDKTNFPRIKYGFTSALKKTENNFYGHNFGQPIAQNTQGVKILLRAPGEAHSVKNWIDYYSAKKQITPEDGENLLGKLENLADFPQESFDDIAKRMKFALLKLKKAVDTFNPNNFLIDNKRKQIYLVDLDKLKVRKPLYTNCDDLLTYPLSDRFLEYDYYKVFTSEQKEKFLDYFEVIKTKCERAYKKHKLNEIEEFFNKN